MTDVAGVDARHPIDVVIVASWFPAYDDEAAGRFVADQAEALAATGAARPLVVSFDGIRLSGGATERTSQGAAALEASVASVRALDPLFVAPAWGVGATIPVARLSVPDGLTKAAGVEHQAVHREAVLRALGERLRAAGASAGGGVVHAHTVYPDGAAAVALADALGWPLVITEHSSFVDRIVSTPELRGRYEAAVARATAVFAVSEMLAAELRSTLPAQAAKIRVLPNTVPVDRFALGNDADRTPDQLLFVGYRKATKGIENLLRAFAVARAARPTVTLRLLGRSPDDETEARWRAVAAEVGVGDAVTFEEPADRAGIAAAMARASLFVHPSPRETFGVVAVEALASGLPVVATDSGGVTEILGPEPDAVGAIVPADDPEALGRAIVTTLERRAAFDPVALRASVERRFGAPFVAERLLVAYREALGGDGVGKAEPIDVGSTADATVNPTAVVALDRGRAAARLSPLPAALRQGLTVVTSRDPQGVALPVVGKLVEVDVAPPAAPRGGSRRGLVGRLSRLAADPVGTLNRRLGRDPAADEAANRVEKAVAGLGDGLELLPLDGRDLLACATDGRAAGRLAAGGLRRLADLYRAAETGGSRSSNT